MSNIEEENAATTIEQMRADLRQELRQEIKDTIVEAHADLINVNKRNTIRLLEEERKKTAPHLLETISGELEATKQQDYHTWRTDVNKSNHDSLKQAEQIYLRAQRFVEACEVTEESRSFHQGAIDMMNKGKQILHERIKMIKFADKESWQAALHFEGNDIAETEAEAKKMQKSVKETERRNDKRAETRKRDFRDKFTGQGSSKNNRGGRQTSTFSPYRSSEDKYCFACRRYGHATRSRDCPRK